MADRPCKWDTAADWPEVQTRGGSQVVHVSKAELGSESLFVRSNAEDIVRASYREGFDHGQIAEDLRSFLNEGTGVEGQIDN